MRETNVRAEEDQPRSILENMELAPTWGLDHHHQH